jgi:hypothetical protein
MEATDVAFQLSYNRWLRRFQKLCRNGQGAWTCKKTARVDDLYLFWFTAPTCAVTGFGVVKSTARKSADRGWYECDFHPLVRLVHPISLEDIHDDTSLAEWWKGKPFVGRPKTIIPEKAAKRLLELVWKRNRRHRALLEKSLRPVRVTPPPPIIENENGKDLGRLSKAAGFESNPRVRRAVESRAMEVVERYYRRLGFAVTDVHKKRSYDFECQSSKKKLFVEVKGTKNLGETITVTANEVRFAQKHAPNVVLCVVHSIKVSGEKTPKATGGKLKREDWNPDPRRLKPIAFRYKLPE